LVGVRDGFALIDLMADRMAQFVENGNRQKSVERHVIAFQEPQALIGRGPKERLLQKGLALIEDRKCGAVGVTAGAPQNRLPIRRLNEDPRPFTKPGQIQTRQYVAESLHVFVAIRSAVPGITEEVVSRRRFRKTSVGGRA